MGWLALGLCEFWRGKVGEGQKKKEGEKRSFPPPQHACLTFRSLRVNGRIAKRPNWKGLGAGYTAATPASYEPQLCELGREGDGSTRNQGLEGSPTPTGPKSLLSIRKENERLLAIVLC